MDEFDTKEDVRISTIDSAFGSIESIECLLAANNEMCWLKFDENLYFRNLIKNLVRFGYSPMKNLFAPSYDWRFHYDHRKQ